MRVRAIVVKDNDISENAFKALIGSSNKVENLFEIERFDAVTPDRINEYNVAWNYPWHGQINDFSSGLIKTAYPTQNKDNRIACALSHYQIWKDTANSNQSTMVLEHDAMFIRKFDIDGDALPYAIIGINDPIGATRRSMDFHEQVQKSTVPYMPVPTIDDIRVPQGLAGNSAYIIKPAGAQRMLRLVEEFGLWPNDALMCKQLVPSLGVTKTYYTKVQGTKSTTTL